MAIKELARKSTNNSTFKIGQKYQGGIIFYIDATGQHGLIAAPFDQSAGIRWDNGSIIDTMISTGEAIGTGSKNTKMIIAKLGTGYYAAKLCDELVLDGYDDWYLPSKDELNQLYKNSKAVSGFTSNNYWSSSYAGLDCAWHQYFDDGGQYWYTTFYTYGVRAIREF